MATVVKDTLNTQTQDPKMIRVPRRSLYRRFWRFLLRVGALFFVKTDVHGRQNFPRSGPLIIVANHNAFMEVGMIQAFAPYQMEFLTTGDIPLEPKFAAAAKIYGYIPVKRGSMDRKAMSVAVNVLEQGGIIVLFPQGGIWDTRVTQARTGVAWLSQKGNAPVLPIGFGGTTGSFKAAAELKRPHVYMNVGEPIPPIPTQIEGMSRKETLEHGTGVIMQAVFDLIPDWEKESWHSIAEEHFALEVEYTTADGAPIEDTPPAVNDPELVGLFFHRPVLLDAMRRNLELPVGVLEQLATERDPAAFRDALDNVLEYVAEANPFFLTYRFGNNDGKKMTQGLRDLRGAAAWAAQNGYTMNIMPIREYRRESETELTRQVYPAKVKEM
jgi:1-acyl-sn-glycerol-3-phosphate acyltransferase